MIAVETKFPQRSPEWFAARCGRVTASSVSKVLATINSGEAAERRNYRAKLVVERLTGKPVETFTNAAMERGSELEPEARMAYEAMTGNIAVESGFWVCDWVGASPDGLIDSDGLLEIKCPSLATHLKYLRQSTVPSEYVAQVQMQLWVTNRTWCDFVSYAPEFPAHLQVHKIRALRDDEYIARLEQEVDRFLDEVHDEVASLQQQAA